jgi:predicted dehydrogenase
MSLRVALIGCGKAADMHLSGILRVGTARIVAICDAEPLMAQQLASRFGVAQWYGDVGRLLAIEKPDVVHIATPPTTHFSLALRAIDAGCHVLVEKPLTVDTSQTRRLIAHAESLSKKLTIGYTYYFDPVARILRKMVQQGQLGAVVHMESVFGYDLQGPFGSTILKDPQHWVHVLPGKLFFNLLDHPLIKITEFLPDENPIVQAYAWQAPNPFVYCVNEFPDELRVTIIGENSSAHLVLSSHSRPIRHSLTVYGTKATAYLDFDSSTIILHQTSGLPGVLGRLTTPFGQGWRHLREGWRNVFRFARSDYHFFSGFDFLLSEFYNSIIRDLPVPIPYDLILRNAVLAEEIVHQLEYNKARVQ